jgi:hypothetical protein
MGQQEEKSGVQKLRERYNSIKNNPKPSKELIDALIKSGKLKQPKDKKVAKPYTPEAGA